ncbi:hypothetical protein, partial [Pseudomonas sp. PA-5-4B]
MFLVFSMISGCRTAVPQLYPLCNLRCLHNDTCGTDQAVSIVEVSKLAETLSQRTFFPVKTVTVTPGYALLLANESTHITLRHSWGAAACFTTLVPSDSAEYAR